MTDPEMALELHAHRRSQERARKQSRYEGIESGRITATDEAAFDRAMELMDREDFSIDDIITQAAEAAQAAARAAGIDRPSAPDQRASPDEGLGDLLDLDPEELRRRIAEVTTDEEG